MWGGNVSGKGRQDSGRAILKRQFKALKVTCPAAPSHHHLTLGSQGVLPWVVLCQHQIWGLKVSSEAVNHTQPFLIGLSCFSSVFPLYIIVCWYIPHFVLNK